MKAKGVENVLVTGGCGFIGSHTVDLLIDQGYNVTVLDNLDPQVHGDTPKIPEYMNKEAKVVIEDFRNSEFLKRNLRDFDAVFHLAALVGIGQSMYQIRQYVDINTAGSATLLDLVANGKHNLKKLVVASSMAIYGEGKYYCPKCDAEVYPQKRDAQELKNKQWNPLCPTCRSPLTPKPTDENKPLMPRSIYAMTKRHQEEMFILVGKTYDVPAVALRYFTGFGSRQALSNPYTGCAVIFTSCILDNKQPYIFEDGKQSRDFIHVKDIARANLCALESNKANYQTINVGSGKAITIEELAVTLAELYGKKELKPYISQKYRKGDIRHCYADTKKAREALNFTTSISLSDGLNDLKNWSETHKEHTKNSFDRSLQELKEKNLIC